MEMDAARRGLDRRQPGLWQTQKRNSDRVSTLLFAQSSHFCDSPPLPLRKQALLLSERTHRHAKKRKRTNNERPRPTTTKTDEPIFLARG